MNLANVFLKDNKTKSNELSEALPARMGGIWPAMELRTQRVPRRVYDALQWLVC